MHHSISLDLHKKTGPTYHSYVSLGSVRRDIGYTTRLLLSISRRNKIMGVVTSSRTTFFLRCLIATSETLIPPYFLLKNLVYKDRNKLYTGTTFFYIKIRPYYYPVNQFHFPSVPAGGGGLYMVNEEEKKRRHCFLFRASLFVSQVRAQMCAVAQGNNTPGRRCNISPSSFIRANQLILWLNQQ